MCLTILGKDVMFDVNATLVVPVEVLGINVYYYNCERDHMEILNP